MTGPSMPTLPAEFLNAMAAIDEQRVATPLSATGSPLLEYAALVGEYDLDWLEARAGGSAAAKSAVLNRSVSVDPWLDRWRLRPDAREAVLVDLCHDRPRLADRIAGATPPAWDEAGRALQLFLEPGRAQHGAAAMPMALPETVPLEAQLEAASWLRDVPGIDTPDPRDLRRTLTRQRTAESLDDLAKRFVGRADQLVRLRAFANCPQGPADRIPVLPVFGIGGIGKSALIARLLHEAPELGPGIVAPLILHLDFDRFGASNATPLELMFELTRQLALHLPEYAAVLDERRKNAQKTLLAVGDESSDTVGSATIMLESASFVGDDLLLGLGETLRDIAHRNCTLLMIFDTVEALQGASIDGLRLLARWIESVRASADWRDIRVVLSGRAEATLPGRRFAHAEPIELDELGDDEAVDLLARLAVPADAARTVVAELGGNPLMLRLVAQLADSAGLPAEALFGAGGDRAAVDKELVQGVLYRRILGHVRDKTVRRLAHPGLALRRITPALIRDVIGPICLERSVEDAEAKALYAALSREVWLVEPAPDGRGMLHRSDLRRLTMRLSSHDATEAARVEQVHRGAIVFYEQGAGRSEPCAAREALYHRFMVADGSLLPRLDGATAAAARAAIDNSLADIPRRNQAALRAALGEAVSDEDAETLPADLRARYVERRGAELARREAYAQALALLDRWPLPGPTAPAWQIAALDAQARWHELCALLVTQAQADSEARQLPEQLIASVADCVAAAIKAGEMRRVDAQVAPARALEAGRGSAPSAAALRLCHYLRRAGRSAPGLDMQIALSDLLGNTELAQELLRYHQVIGVDRVPALAPLRYRPMRTQFLPDLAWLGRLREIAGPMVEKPLSDLICQIEQSAPERLVMGRYLGQLSSDFEALWTDAFVRGRIPPEALVMMAEIREFVEFRTAARTTLLAAFADPADLAATARGFASRLPVCPHDLTPEGTGPALDDPRGFAINLVAFVDRCQLLYPFLGFAAGRAADESGIGAVRAGMRRWFTEAEARGYEPA